MLNQMYNSYKKNQKQTICACWFILEHCTFRLKSSLVKDSISIWLILSKKKIKKGGEEDVNFGPYLVFFLL